MSKTKNPNAVQSTGIRSALTGVRSKYLKNKSLLIFENGRVFSNNKKRGIVECTVTNLNSYKAVSNNVNDIEKYFYVHFLLAEAFIPNPKNKPFVCFKDNNPSNTDIHNLFWATKNESELGMELNEKAETERVMEQTNDLRSLRLLKGLTLKETADYIGIPLSNYAYKEKHPSSIKVYEGIKLADLYDKKVEELFPQ